MKGLFLYLALLLSCGLVSAQERDSVLLQMNAVKLNPDLIYGYGISNNVDSARCEALLDLSPRVTAYLESQQSRFLPTLDQCPVETVRYLDLRIDTVYARSIAYVSKQELRDFEVLSAEEFDHQGLGEAIILLKDQMIRSTTIEELEQILGSTPATSLVKYGPVSFSTKDQYIVGGYIVYFDRKTGRIVEFRTPIGADGQRRDVRSGYPCEKTVPNGTTPYWIYIEEPHISIP